MMNWIAGQGQGASPGLASSLTACEGAGMGRSDTIDHHQERKCTTFKLIARVKVTAWLAVLFAVVCWLSFIEESK